ncbi:MAG TPA: hypothetical protein VGK73_08040 [Polyangiaceae bacterium]
MDGEKGEWRGEARLGIFELAGVLGTVKAGAARKRAVARCASEP